MTSFKITPTRYDDESCVDAVRGRPAGMLHARVILYFQQPMLPQLANNRRFAYPHFKYPSLFQVNF